MPKPRSSAPRGRRPRPDEMAVLIKPRAIDERVFAELPPPDPAVWFDAVLDAKMELSVSERYIGWAPPEDPRQQFSLPGCCQSPRPNVRTITTRPPGLPRCGARAGEMA
jgi:hypothetical protein